MRDRLAPAQTATAQTATAQTAAAQTAAAEIVAAEIVAAPIATPIPRWMQDGSRNERAMRVGQAAGGDSGIALGFAAMIARMSCRQALDRGAIEALRLDGHSDAYATPFAVIKSDGRASDAQDRDNHHAIVIVGADMSAFCLCGATGHISRRTAIIDQNPILLHQSHPIAAIAAGATPPAFRQAWLNGAIDIMGPIDIDPNDRDSAIKSTYMASAPPDESDVSWALEQVRHLRAGVVNDIVDAGRSFRAARQETACDTEIWSHDDRAKVMTMPGANACRSVVWYMNEAILSRSRRDGAFCARWSRLHHRVIETRRNASGGVGWISAHRKIGVSPWEPVTGHTLMRAAAEWRPDITAARLGGGEI